MFRKEVEDVFVRNEGELDLMKWLFEFYKEDKCKLYLYV